MKKGRYVRNLRVLSALFSLLMTTLNASAADTVRISAVGDIMMGTTFPREILPPEDGGQIFDQVSAVLKDGDIVFGNLEGPLIDGGEAAKCKVESDTCYEFRTPVRYVSHLKKAGFTVMNIANNHASDFGPEGIGSTVAALESAGIRAVGGHSVAILNVKGRRIAIVGFSYTTPSVYSYSMLDIPAAMRIVGELKKSNDIVIVSFHGGAEGKAAAHVYDQDEVFLNEERGNVVRFSRSVIDAGADMVIGHGPHVVRAMDVYRGKLIAFSLGNFLTYERFNISGPNGLSVILKADLDAETGNFMEGELIPVKLLNEGIPEIDPASEGVELIKNLTADDMGSPVLLIADDGILKLLKKGQNDAVLKTRRDDVP
jgi:poly-gamma-glutamate capsule biosynthesis protein CapA/YwtB (metallophosphatase superfamily)